MDAPAKSETKKRALLCLSPLLRFDEISEEEWTFMRSNYEDKHSTLEEILVKILPESKRSKTELIEEFGEKIGEEKHVEIKDKTFDILRSQIYALRRTAKKDLKDVEISEEKFMKEFHKGLNIQTDSLHISLRNSMIKTLDVSLNVRVMFMSITNPTILKLLKEIISNAAENGRFTMKVLTRALFEMHILTPVSQCDESEEFSRLIRPYLEMSRDLNNDILYEAIIPALDGKLQIWEVVSENIFKIQLSEDVTHKIREHTAVFLDIVIPGTLILSYDTENCVVNFIAEKNPHARVARGGLHIGTLENLRSLSKLEIEESPEKKPLESSLKMSLGMNWVLGMFKLKNPKFNLAHSTLWWYFRNGKKN